MPRLPPNPMLSLLLDREVMQVVATPASRGQREQQKPEQAKNRRERAEPHHTGQSEK